MLKHWKTRINIEKSIYDNRLNVALSHFENSRIYKAFKTNLQKALYYQIKQIADKENIIDSVDLLLKGDNPEAEQLIGTYITRLSELINLHAFLVKAGTAGGQAALDKIGIQGMFGLKNPEIIKFFEDHTNLIIDSIDKYTKEWIASKIKEGKDKLLNPHQIADTLVDLGKGISKVRAERIVLTETANALVRVELEAATKYGIERKAWRTSRDELVCPICMELDGQEVAIDNLFEGTYEGPPAHPSCRCFIEEIIPPDWTQPEVIWLGE